jgi:hypothetical protein
MSADILRIIPADPDYVPDAGSQQMALALFSSFVAKADSVNVIVNDDISFIDPGENWESVSCPACGADLGAWWQEAAEVAYQNGFTDLNISVPCCGAEGSLNDLIYVPPAGFARFVLEATNPVNDVNAAQLSLLAGMMKCQIRKVMARYS